MKLTQFIEKSLGLNSVHIIADYDRTITLDAEDHHSIVSILRRSASEKMQNYSKESFALKDKYILFENDPSLDLDFRSRMMREWWSKHFELMIENGMSEAFVNRTVDQHKTIFREGFRELNSFCANQNVPLVIMSAGIGNMIERVLKNEGLWHDGIHIVSNDMIFNENGLMVDYSRPVIHTFSKNEAYMSDGVKSALRNRPNVIIMGDSLGDANMADGIPHNLVCKIAFERFQTNDALRAEYARLFDEVMGFNESFSFVNEALLQIINNDK